MPARLCSAGQTAPLAVVSLSPKACISEDWLDKPTTGTSPCDDKQRTQKHHSGRLSAAPACVLSGCCSNYHAKKPNFNANGAFVEYTSNFLCNCAAHQIQQIPEQCESAAGPAVPTTAG